MLVFYDASATVVAHINVSVIPTYWDDWPLNMAIDMMTSWNRNTFRITDRLRGECFMSPIYFSSKGLLIWASLLKNSGFPMILDPWKVLLHHLNAYHSSGYFGLFAHVIYQRGHWLYGFKKVNGMQNVSGHVMAAPPIEPRLKQKSAYILPNLVIELQRG